MKYSIVGSGLVGKTLAGIFARANTDVLIANSRGPESLAEIAAELGPHIIPAAVDQALDADIIFFAVGFLHFKEWTSHGIQDTPEPRCEALSKASGLTPPRWLCRRVRL